MQEPVERSVLFMNTKKFFPILFALMLGGLLWSRAVLSLVNIAWLFFIIANHHTWKPGWKKNPLLIWSVCPLLLYFFGWWQDPLQAKNYDYLLSLLVYPVAALAVGSIHIEETKKICLKIWAVASVSGLLYPITWFMINSSKAIQSYGEGSSLPVFMDNDHLRFGMFLCAGFLFLVVHKTKKSLQKNLLLLFMLCIIFFLAVRTAWLMVLITIFCFLLLPEKGATRTNTLKKIKVSLLLVAVTVLACFVFPTVQKKIAYTIYDWQQYQPGQYHSGFSDGARRAVNAAAWKAVTKEDRSNRGWDGVAPAISAAFEKYFPGATPDFHWPFNQYLFWWMGSGFAGMLLFAAWLFYPVLWGWKNNNKAVIAWSLAIAASCLFESNLVFQYGIWLHAWPMALLWTQKNQASLFTS